jgi:hypothetical protein
MTCRRVCMSPHCASNPACAMCHCIVIPLMTHRIEQYNTCVFTLHGAPCCSCT